MTTISHIIRHAIHIVMPVCGTVAVAPGKKSATLTDNLGPKTFRIYKVKR